MVGTADITTLQKSIGRNKMLDEPLKLAIADFFEQLQAYIIISGGRKIPIEELKEMGLGEITEPIYPTGLRFRVDSINCVRNLK